ECGATFKHCIVFFDHVKEHGQSCGSDIICRWPGCESKEKKSIGKLVEHLRVHTGQKHSACFQCGTVFCSKTKLVDHIHTQQPNQNTENEYRCDFCLRYKPTKKLLKDHVRKHLNTHKCPHCQMSCPTKSALQRHILYRHPELSTEKNRTVKCQICSKNLKNSDVLKDHYKNVHLKAVNKSKSSREGSVYQCIS
ncbi:MAG: hypothetical protein MHPSP_001834, partial [Paramarteilia canceri]